jgi:hypothetical protein
MLTVAGTASVAIATTQAQHPGQVAAAPYLHVAAEAPVGRNGVGELPQHRAVGQADAQAWLRRAGAGEVLGVWAGGGGTGKVPGRSGRCVARLNKGKGGGLAATSALFAPQPGSRRDRGAEGRPSRPPPRSLRGSKSTRWLPLTKEGRSVRWYTALKPWASGARGGRLEVRLGEGIPPAVQGCCLAPAAVDCCGRYAAQAT